MLTFYACIARQACDGPVEPVVDMREQPLRVTQAHDLRIAHAMHSILWFIAKALPLLQRSYGALQNTARLVEVAEHLSQRRHVDGRRRVERFVRHSTLRARPYSIGTGARRQDDDIPDWD